MSITLAATQIRKTYNRRMVLPGISFNLGPQSSLAIVGKNGAGKSTLAKILAGVLSPSSGTISMTYQGKELNQDEWYRHIGFVAPYLQLYDEFSAWENLHFMQRVRGLHLEDQPILAILERVGLGDRSHDMVRTFSSGMKQRLKYACALLHSPPILILDEPTANLDKQGGAVVHEIVKEQQLKGIVVVATNEPEERTWAGREIDLDTAGKEEQ